MTGVTCCKDCPDRTVEPNCHTDCERYLKALDDLQRIREQKIKRRNIEAYVARTVSSNKRRRR